MLALHEKLQATKTDQERTVLERQIETTDRQSDRLVCGLNGRTNKEIAVVEETTAG